MDTKQCGRDILSVEICAPERPGRMATSAEINLPASPWTLWDALERAQIMEGCTMCTVGVLCSEPQNLSEIIAENVDLFELNRFARRIAELEEWQLQAFEGLVLMEQQSKAFHPIPLKRLINMTYSLDECQVVYEAHNDEMLGKFYVDNGFVPELEPLPEKVFPWLNYAIIGKGMREAEGGVFAPCGYVVQNGRMAQVYHDGGGAPEKPNYAIRLLVFGVKSPDEGMTHLGLPTDNVAIEQVLEQLGVSSLAECGFSVEDCIVPQLAEAVADELADCGGDITVVDAFSMQLLQMDQERTLPPYKAMLNAASKEVSLNAAILLTDHAMEFELKKGFAIPSDYAAEEIRKSNLPLKEEPLSKVHLHHYGEKLMAQRGMVSSDYGFLYSTSGQTVDQLLQELESHMESGMQMR